MNYIGNFLSRKGSFKVEKPKNQVAHLIIGVPRSYKENNGASIIPVEITHEMVIEALRDLINISLVRIIEPRNSLEA